MTKPDHMKTKKELLLEAYHAGKIPDEFDVSDVREILGIKVSHAFLTDLVMRGNNLNPDDRYFLVHLGERRFKFHYLYEEYLLNGKLKPIPVLF